MGDGTSYVRVHASRGTIRVTLTAIVASPDTRTTPAVAVPGQFRKPGADAMPAPPWARPAPPSGQGGQSPA